MWDALTVVVLISFSALRYRVGTDFDLYLVLYKRLYVGNWIEQLATSPQEFGFTLMSLVLRENFKSPYALLWATSVLTVVPAYAAMKKRSADMPMSIVTVRAARLLCRAVQHHSTRHSCFAIVLGGYVS
ncbi:MAG: EpsG family protein [Kineosporiaceae bacterium]|nr:EpsG family protein [Kineosporiaceae bacterium]